MKPNSLFCLTPDANGHKRVPESSRQGRPSGYLGNFMKFYGWLATLQSVNTLLPGEAKLKPYLGYNECFWGVAARVLLGLCGVWLLAAMELSQLLLL